MAVQDAIIRGPCTNVSESHREDRVIWSRLSPGPELTGLTLVWVPDMGIRDLIFLLFRRCCFCANFHSPKISGLVYRWVDGFVCVFVLFFLMGWGSCLTEKYVLLSLFFIWDWAQSDFIWPFKHMIYFYLYCIFGEAGLKSVVFRYSGKHASTEEHN